MPHNAGHREANLFSVSFSAQTVSTAGPWDLFGLYASTSPVTRCEIISFNIGLSSSAISATPQSIGLQLLRGSTASSTSTASPQNLKGWSGSPTAASSATAPSSTPVSTASATLIWSDVFYTAGGWRFPPEQAADFVRPVIASGQRLHLRLATPQIAVVVSGVMVFKELGAGLPS